MKLASSPHDFGIVSRAHAFKHETERLVNELKRSSESAEAKLEMIEERSESLLQNSYHISDSLKTTGIQIQQAAQMSRKLEDHMDTVLNHSEEVYEQSRRIETSKVGTSRSSVGAEKKFGGRNGNASEFLQEF